MLKFLYEVRGVEVLLGKVERKKVVGSFDWNGHSTSGVCSYSFQFL